jgi:O-antigen ligase
VALRDRRRPPHARPGLGIVSAAILVVEQPSWPPVELLHSLVIEDYLIVSNPITAAGLFAEGLLLMLAVADLCGGDPRRRREIARMLMIGAAAAASLNVIRIVAVAVAREEPWAAFLNYIAALRVNVHFSDLNAAGSYFAMALFVALGLTRGSRGLAVACAGLIASGLWISGSRTAFAAVLIVAVAWGARALWEGRHRRLAVAALVLVCATSVLMWAYYPRDRNVSAPIAFQIRASLARGAMDMVRSEPLFGVGIGRFYVLSVDYTLRQYIQPRENAHNNYLQVLAELGVPGLMLFLALIVLALKEGLHAARGSPVVAGLVAGVGAYLLTCLGGHPLLVDAAAYPFWIAISLAATTATDETEKKHSDLEKKHIGDTGHRGSMIVIVGLVIAIAGSLPFRIARADEQANLEGASAGFSLWQREKDGSRYRWAGGRSSFFAPAAANAVVIPLRAGPAASSTVEVRIFIDRREADRVVLEPGGEWRRTRLLLLKRSSAPFVRIDLEAAVQGVPRPADAKSTDSSGLLMVGRPEFAYPPGVSR